MVYNTLGQEIAMLVNKKMAAGIYNVDFNGSNLNSGVYFYRLSVNDIVSTKKMILVK